MDNLTKFDTDEPLEAFDRDLREAERATWLLVGIIVLGTLALCGMAVLR